jgi:hypothetical protein
MEVFPLIAPGWPGIGVTVTVRLRMVLDPHELFAVTEILPPLAPAVAVIDSELEVPLHPEGNVHV